MNYLKDQIYYTFIHEHRYRLFLDGICITLLLTVASFLLGTVFGIILCAARRSRNKTVMRIATMITAILVQIPTMVMLMIMVYLIFGESSIPVLVLVIIGLTFKTGAYISEIINTALNAIDPGELEAARTLGMSRLQTFRYIVLPQVINTGISLYKNQFIVSMQETSVVGYLAVVDITRVSSIIASRTMDSYFSLIVITLIYFLIGHAGKKLIDLMGSRKHMVVEG